MGDIPNNELSIIRNSVIGVNNPGFALLLVNSIGNSNDLQITYAPFSMDVQTRQSALNFMVGFYIAVKHQFSDINGCQYVEINGDGNTVGASRIVGTYTTLPEWLNGLALQSNGLPTQESLTDLIYKTDSTFQSPSYDPSSTIPSYNQYPIDTMTTRQAIGDHLLSCSLCEAHNKRVDKAYKEDGFAEDTWNCDSCQDP
jgi:hypothetical protein